MRNLLASDLFTDSELRIFCGAEFRHQSKARNLDEFFPEPDPEEESDGPDPYDFAVEDEMEREVRDGHLK